MKTKTNDENIHIGKLFSSLLSYWKTFAIICAFTLSVGILFWILTPKHYKTAATLLLVSDQQDMVSQMRALQMTGLSAMLGGSGSGINVDDQITIINSTEVLGKTIRDLNLQISIQESKDLKRIKLFEDSPVKIEASPQLLESLEKEIEIELYFETPTRIRLKLNDGWFSSFETETKDLPATFTIPNGEIKIFNSSTLKKEDTEKLFIEITPFNKRYEEYQKLISIKSTNPISDILEISIEDECRALSSATINSLIENYNKYSVAQKHADSQRNDRFIEERLEEIGKELSDYEYRIENYKKKNKLTDIETDVKLNLTSSEAYKSKQTELEVQRKLLDYVVNYLNNPSNNSSIIPVVLSGTDKESPVAAGIAAYNLLIGEQIKLKQVSGELNPALVSINEQILRQRKNLTELIETYRQSIDLSIGELDKTNNRYKRWIGSLPTNEREFIEIKRQQAVKEALLVFLLQKNEEYRMSNNPYQLNGRIVDAPYHSFKHTFPKGSIVLPVALIVGFIIALIVVFMQEFVYRKTISTRDLNEELQLPLFVKQGNIEELCSRILCSSSGVIQLMEDNKQNGSSPLAHALLQRLEYMQKRAVLVSTVETGLTKENEVCYPSTLSPYSEQAQKLFEQLKAENDVILLLHKPILHSTEALDFASFADLSLCIVRPDITRKASMEKYRQWYEARLFRRLEIAVNPLKI